MSTRVDPDLPLPRWRVRGELVEIRAADLRFTADEAAAYLNDVAGLGLADGDVAVLEQRTEGGSLLYNSRPYRCVVTRTLAGSFPGSRQ
jgi:ATP/maltotriose-dependent transcriptional regulator MalT